MPSPLLSAAVPLTVIFPLMFICSVSSASAFTMSFIVTSGAARSTFTVATLTLWLFPVPALSVTVAYTVMFPESPANAAGSRVTFLYAVLFFLPSASVPSTSPGFAVTAVPPAAVRYSIFPYVVTVSSSFILRLPTSINTLLIPAGSMPVSFAISFAVSSISSGSSRFVYTVSFVPDVISGTCVSTFSL